MRRYFIYTIIALAALLLVFSAGVWVGTNQDPWSYFTEEQTAKTDSKPQIHAPELDEPSDGEEDPRTTDDLLIRPDPDDTEHPDETEPYRVSPPPDPVDNPDKGSIDDAAADGDEGVYAVSTFGMPEVGSGNEAGEEINPFIVSTLDGTTRSWWTDRFRESLNTPLIKKDKDSPFFDYYIDPLPDFPYLLLGTIKFPEVDKETLDKLADLHAYVATVSTPGFTDLYCDTDDGYFALHLTKEEANLYRDEGLALRVHSPAFRLPGGKSDVIVSSSSHSPLIIELEESPPAVVTVNISTPEAVEQGVEVWVERRGEEVEGQDSLFMRCKVPSSGRLHFVIPQRYGIVHVGACGERWHSGLPRKLYVDRDRDRHTVNLKLANDFCDFITGEVWQDVNEAKQDSSEDRKEVAAARLQSTHFGTVTYTDSTGGFEVWAPVSNKQTPRQLIVSKYMYPDEVISLEPSGVSSTNVEFAAGGRSIFGPWSVCLQRWVLVRAEWEPTNDPPEYELRAFSRGGSFDAERGYTVHRVRWGERIFQVLPVEGGEYARAIRCMYVPETYWLSAERDRKRVEVHPKLSMKPLERYIEWHDEALSKNRKKKPR